MWNIGKSTCILLLVCLSVAGIAQEKTIKRGNQQWLQYYGQVKLSDKWTFLADGGYRVTNNFRVSSQYIIRAGANYALNSNIQVGGGFAHVGFYTSGKISRAEFRPYQELSIKSKLNNADISNRIRAEERLFNPVVEGSIKSPGTFNFRFRYQFMMGIPLFNLSPTNKDKLVLLIIVDKAGVLRQFVQHLSLFVFFTDCGEEHQ